ncbi:hypothetical protein COEREDRAFT_80122 [Coemansia reversa NRRL 1564]|uniref:Roadblock/LAMTOR2 domain-containing protein n=1 Tax=Coemansia reversa (strain ATCC 12441 / NRRL 1564) TaxID=763665 RepID=A0A2G5BGS4_COERN|nr:hypothetical protein COEREDRAFT_80122 [Coemansia reversa NRRL 1564]|eukprot:PIA18224.1 hypothetical protein COEREDRAFT_80122 [Coemansia reversa NRRL 1564]
MLRSKNLKKVLEQALTSEIPVCAVFNAEGVVLAHATSAKDVEMGEHYEQFQRFSSFATDTSNADRRNPAIAGRGVGEESYLYTRERGTSQESEQPLNPQSGSTKDRVGGTEESQRRQIGFSATASEQLQTHHASQPLHSGGPYIGGYRHPDDSQVIEDDSASSFGDINSEDSREAESRERLDDDLAIVASLWKGYEGLPGLIESKDRDIDDYLGDTKSEIQGEAMGNNLHMAIIECKNGKAAVTRLGSYRLFLLSRPTTPLGMLRLKSDNLCRFLEQCLQPSGDAF